MAIRNQVPSLRVAQIAILRRVSRAGKVLNFDREFPVAVSDWLDGDAVSRGDFAVGSHQVHRSRVHGVGTVGHGRAVAEIVRGADNAVTRGGGTARRGGSGQGRSLHWYGIHRRSMEDC